MPVNGKALLTDSTVPSEARAILQRACQDCHSDNTKWPWYSHVPLISRQIHDDVTRGRAVMNFSKWNEYSDRQRTGFLLAMLAATKTRDMPPSKYVWIHSDAKLSDADLKVLENWAISEIRAHAQRRKVNSRPRSRLENISEP